MHFKLRQREIWGGDEFFRPPSQHHDRGCSSDYGSIHAWDKPLCLKPMARQVIRYKHEKSQTFKTRSRMRNKNVNPGCHLCGSSHCSAAHLWGACPYFEEPRLELQRLLSLSAAWWQRQPSTTSRSGRITLNAAAAVARRATLQVARCSLGLRIMKADVSNVFSGC